MVITCSVQRRETNVFQITLLLRAEVYHYISQALVFVLRVENNMTNGAFGIVVASYLFAFLLGVFVDEAEVELETWLLVCLTAGNGLLRVLGLRLRLPDNAYLRCQ